CTALGYKSSQKDETSGCHTDNVNEYLVLVVLKLGLDVTVLYMCCRKWYTSFLNMCSLYMVLADFVMVLFFSSVLFLEPERYLGSLCFILAHASTTYEALPLPMMCLGLLDYCLEGTCLGKQSNYSKFLRHTALALLVWILALIYSIGSVKANLIEMDLPDGLSALVCKVPESTLISYFTVGLFLAVVCTMLPFWSTIPQWVREADRIYARMEEPENHSDLLSNPTNCMETNGIEEKSLEEIVCPLFWMPYLTVSVVCIVLGFGVPAYITVNLLWLECTVSLLMGVVFWAYSDTQEPYRLPDNICMWPIYWHLSKGTGQQPFNPSHEKKHTLLCV
uniref:Uncharacterized protein n=1 Tax=Cyclopterus lumpus TaxID=8103 RepID=A0A8C2WLC1_CYCLU